jgi:hypothetical protein
MKRHLRVSTLWTFFLNGSAISSIFTGFVITGINYCAAKDVAKQSWAAACEYGPIFKHYQVAKP